MSGFNQLQIPPIYRGIRPHDGRAGSNTLQYEVNWMYCIAVDVAESRSDRLAGEGVSWAAI